MTTKNEDLQLLRWAVLGCDEVEHPERLSTERIVGVLREHRVVGRALRRASEGAPRWLSGDAVARLEREQEQVQAAFARQLDGLAKISGEYLCEERRVVLLKGYSCYLATNKPEALRHTLDVDLVCSDNEALVAAIRARGNLEYRTNVSPHELINARVCGLDLDVHRHYPVWSKEHDAGTVSFGQSGTAGALFHRGHLSVGALSPEDLLEQAVRVEQIVDAHVFRPCAAAAIIIHSAHCYRNYLSRSSVSMRLKPTVRFVELAEIRDYLSLDDFDPACFVELVERSGAAEAVRWVATLLARYLDDDRLLKVADGAASRERAWGFPVIVWGGIWADLRYQAEDLFGRHRATASVVCSLGGGRLVGTEHSGEVNQSRTEGLPAGGLVHLFEQDGSRPTLRWRVRLTEKEAEVCVESSLVRSWPNQRLMIDLGGFAFECNFNLASGEARWKHSEHPVEPQVQWSSSELGHRVVLRLPMEAGRPWCSQSTPVLVGAGAFERQHVMRAGVVVPFTVERTRGTP